jgi:hypothetical protein
LCLSALLQECSGLFKIGCCMLKIIVIVSKALYRETTCQFQINFITEGYLQMYKT